MLADVANAVTRGVRAALGRPASRGSAAAVANGETVVVYDVRPQLGAWAPPAAVIEAGSSAAGSWALVVVSVGTVRTWAVSPGRIAVPPNARLTFTASADGAYYFTEVSTTWDRVRGVP